MSLKEVFEPKRVIMKETKGIYHGTFKSNETTLNLQSVFHSVAFLVFPLVFPPLTPSNQAIDLMQNKPRMFK